MLDTLQASLDKLHATFERTDLEVEWKKLQQKVDEARYNPGDVTPLADCIYSLLLAARSRGFSAKAVFRALEKVADENLKREWKRMPDGTYRGM